MEKILTSEQAAYLAGIIDGEGTVRLQQQRRAEGKLHHRTAFVTVANTRLELMHWLMEVTGCGTVTKQQRQAPCKTCYTWRIGSGPIRKIMPQVEPYMVLKQDRTRLLLRYLELREHRAALSHDEMDEVTHICAEIARLNATGIHPERDAELQDWFGKKRCQEPDCERWCYPNQDFCYRHWVSRRIARLDTCRHCGRAIEVVYQKRKQFCSPECRSKQFYVDKTLPAAAAEAAAREALPCPTCGKPVDRSHYARKVFCSDHCRESQRAKKKKLEPEFTEERTCRQCGVAFQVGRHARKTEFCSHACVNKAYRQRQAEAA